MMKKKIFVGLFVACVAVTVASVASLSVVYDKVRSFDEKNKCDVLAGLTAEEIARQRLQESVEEGDGSGKGGASRNVAVQSDEESQNAAAKENTDVKCGGKNASAPLKVLRVDYDDDRELRVVFSERPDMDVVRQYFRVGPMAEGVAGFRYSARYNYKVGEYESTVFVTGEFAYRTNVTLKVLKGFPLYGKGANPAAEGSLQNDFSYTFRRKDPPPAVAFADDGRYLPPGGRDAIRISAISVANIATEIWRVEPRNVVQLLAREERVYRRGGWSEATADEQDTDELSGACETGMIRCVNRPCEKETCLFSVAMKDGGPRHGIFLTAVRNGDRPRDENEWRNPKYNPNLFRLVCLSDLGLSVRKVKSEGDGEEVGVWVTSLSTGRPVAGARIEIYSTANTLVAEGVADANGWCVPKRCAKGEAFAVVARTAARDDMTFLALRDSMKIDETYADGARPEYLKAGEMDAFVWTERGIYRHEERIFAQAVLRCDAVRGGADGTVGAGGTVGVLRAPRPMPVVLCLKSPRGNVFASKTVVTDAEGAVSYDGFSVPAEQPSGKWKIEVRLPGKDGGLLAEREVKVEEFAPPQIRVRVAADETLHPSNFTFRVSAEHLFGAPARSLACEGAVVFEDVPFAPAAWKGFTFGNEELGLKPCFRQLSQRTLDDQGACDYEASLWADSGLPKAAVRATGQGVVFEDGGRPATARKTVICHYYPFYIGANLPSWLRRPKTGFPKVDLVCVSPKGEAVKGARKLVGKIERIDSVYSYRKNDDGLSTWDCERIRSTVMEGVTIDLGADGTGSYELPLKDCGDYVFTATDPATGASFGRAFYLSDWGDNVVRAPLSNPTEVTIRTDKSFYRVGERPRLVVKSPFAGYAIMSVMREGAVYSEVLNLTNATSEVVLRPVERSWAPNVDVSISVVQSVAANARHLASRAYGMATVRVRPAENELDVRLAAKIEVERVGGDGSGDGEGGSRVSVDVEAVGAEYAVVTVVDEGINLLTGEETPNPVAWLSRVRTALHPLYDIYNRVLPVADDGLRKNGVKTGGGFGAEMLARVSPVPTRRFKPLALWQEKIPVKNGKAHVDFKLPEFVGEVRVTAFAYSSTATGAASVQKKVSPKLIMHPDAPRFVAPGDAFEVTLPIRIQAKAKAKAKARGEGEGEEMGEVEYSILVDGRAVLAGRAKIEQGGFTNVVARLVAPKKPGEMCVGYWAKGLGETHRTEIRVPVRPAVAWRTEAGVRVLQPGEKTEFTAVGGVDCFQMTPNGTPISELVSALEWLADYPHGCLEQTSSRIFPLIAAGGILNTVASKAATNRAAYVAAGVRRVESMIRENDFVMWPDCSYAPWDREVSLYAAHFLVEAEKAGEKLNPSAREKVMRFLKKWAMSTNDCVSAYACHTLALAGAAEKDRMFRLYDGRDKLDFLSRARLARAFTAIRDVPRAEALMKDALEPQSVKEAAFRVLALLDLNPEDARIPALVTYLTACRDKTRFCWGTTEANAHALLAIGAYYERHPVSAGRESRPVRGESVGAGRGACPVRGEPVVRCSGIGREGAAIDETISNRMSRTFWATSVSVKNEGGVPAFLNWHQMTLPEPSEVVDESNGIFVSRRFLRPDGAEADLGKLVRGELLIAELTVTSDVTRVIGDLVIEDLFAGAFEPVHREMTPPSPSSSSSPSPSDWIMRKDARDDRMLVFSKRFELKKDYEAKVFYPVRVVSAGDYILPGPTVEGMYHHELRSRRVPGRIVVRP